MLFVWLSVAVSSLVLGRSPMNRKGERRSYRTCIRIRVASDYYCAESSRLCHRPPEKKNRTTGPRNSRWSAHKSASCGGTEYMSRRLLSAIRLQTIPGLLSLVGQEGTSPRREFMCGSKYRHQSQKTRERHSSCGVQSSTVFCERLANVGRRIGFFLAPLQIIAASWTPLSVLLIRDP